MLFKARLSDVDLQLGVGMIVTPIPVSLLIPGVQPIEIVVFTMPLLHPHVIGAVLVVIPDMVIVMLGILITTGLGLFSMVVLGECCNRNRSHQGRA